MKKIVKRIHATAPVRVCDIGGWTDTWFAGHGAVFHIAVTPNVEVHIRVSLQDSDERVTLNLRNFNETFSLNPAKITYGKHPLIEASIDSMEIPPGVSLEIDIFSDAPSGASVGTSAAVCVALIAALDALTPGRMAPCSIAKLAHAVETEKLGLQSGIQDQLCCAYGGINFIDMHAFPHSTISPVKIPQSLWVELDKRLALFFIGTPHNSSNVHKKVIADLGENARLDPRIQRLRELAPAAKNALDAGDLETLGEVMSMNTDMQRALHPHLVCDKFEEIIEIAHFFKVSGWKVNGAGGDGGSITVLGDGDFKRKQALIHALEKKGYRSIPVSLSSHGVRVCDEDM